MYRLAPLQVGNGASDDDLKGILQTMYLRVRFYAWPAGCCRLLPLRASLLLFFWGRRASLRCQTVSSPLKPSFYIHAQKTRKACCTAPEIKNRARQARHWPHKAASPAPVFLNIQILHGQGVMADKLAARFHTVAHQLHKGIRTLSLRPSTETCKSTRFSGSGGCHPELVGVHFLHQDPVTLDVDTSGASSHP